MKKKILIYEAFILYYYHFVTGLEIALDHINNGDEVHYLTCNSNLKTCYNNVGHNLNICIACNTFLLNGLKTINFNMDNLIYMKLDKYRENIIIPKFKNLNEFQNFEIDGIDFGQAAYSSLVSHEREPFFDIDYYREIIEKTLIDEIAIYHYTNDLLIKNNYDTVYLFNGRFATQRPIIRICQKNNINFFTYEVSTVKEQYTLAKNNYNHSPKYLEEAFNLYWEKEKDYNLKYKIAKDFYLRRLNGEHSLYTSFTNYQIKGKLPKNFDKNKYNIVIFNSSEDEYIGFKEYSNSLYKREVEAFENIIRNTKDKNIHYYLRVHPNLKNLDNSQINSIKNLNYDNLTVILPESDISTYDLMKSCDKVLTTVSTTGVEANFFNKVVISIGKSSYDSLNIAYKPKTYREIIELIEDRNLKPLSNEGAIKFAWYSRNNGTPFKYYNDSTGEILGKKIDFSTDINTLMNTLESIYYSNFQPIKEELDLVSIIIIIYNTLDIKTIESIRNQSYKKIEIIIVNLSNNIIDNIEDNRIIYIEEKSKNIPEIRNKVIKLSKGKYIRFIDSGNILFKNSVELMLSKIKDNKSIKVIISTYLRKENDIVNTIFLNNKILDNKKNQLIQQIFFNSIDLNSLLIDKDIFNTIGYFDENITYFVDFNFFFKIIKELNYLYIDVPTYIKEKIKNNKHIFSYEDIFKIRILNSILDINKDTDFINNLFEKLALEKNKNIELLINLLDKLDTNNNKRKTELISDYNYDIFNILYQDINYLSEENNLFNKIFLIINNLGLIRYNYRLIFFTTKDNHKIVLFSWYLGILPSDIINYINTNIDLLIVPSKDVLDNVSNLGIDPYKIKVLNDYIDYEVFKPINIRKNDKFTFVYSGKINYFSGLDILIKVFKEEFKDNEAKLIIHCNGIYDINYLTSLENKLNNNIEIIYNDFLDIDFNEFINKAHCFVYPYRLEGNILDLLKPMASNIPIILTNNILSEDLPIDLLNKVKSEKIEEKSISLVGINAIEDFYYYELNENILKDMMRDIYTNYQKYENNSIKLRDFIIHKYNKDNNISNLNKYISELKENLPIQKNLEYLKELWYEKARTSFENKNYNESKKYLERLTYYEENKIYYYYLALSLYNQEKYDEAINYFTEALSLGLYNYDILNYISDALYKIGDIETSNYYKQKLLEL